MFNKSKQYLELYVHQDRAYFVGNQVADDIREVFRKNPELANAKIRVQFCARRCAGCGKVLKAAMCYEYRGKTVCGACKGSKDDFNDTWERRFKI